MGYLIMKVKMQVILRIKQRTPQKFIKKVNTSYYLDSCLTFFIGSEVLIKSYKDSEVKEKVAKEPNFLFSIMSDSEKNGSSNKLFLLK